MYCCSEMRLRRSTSIGPAVTVLLCALAAACLASAVDAAESRLSIEELERLADGAERDYYAQRYEGAVNALQRLVAERPEDALATYRLYFSLNELGTAPQEAAEAKRRAHQLMRQRLRGDADDPVALYYLSALSEGEEAELIRAAIRDTLQRDRRPRRDLFALSRLLNLAVEHGASAGRQWRILRATLQVADGAWSRQPYLFDVTRNFHAVGQANDRLDELQSELDRAIKAQPRDGLLRLARAEFLRERGLTAGARRELDGILTTGTMTPQFLYRAGLLVEALGNDVTAVELYRSYLRLTETSTVWRRRGAAEFRLERYDEAEASLGSALALNDKDVFAWLRLAGVFVATDRVRQAHQAYGAAVTVGGSAQWVRRSYARFLEQREQLEAALQVLQETGGDEPELQTVILRARMLWRIDRNAHAVQEIELALPRFPDEPTLHRYLALALRDRDWPGDGERALRSNAKAIALEPETPAIRRERVSLLWRFGQERAAIRLQRELIDADPSRVADWRRLGQMLLRSEPDLDVVVAGLRQALDRFPLDPELLDMMLIAVRIRGHVEQRDNA